MITMITIDNMTQMAQHFSQSVGDGDGDDDGDEDEDGDEDDDGVEDDDGGGFSVWIPENTDNIMLSWLYIYYVIGQ